MSSRYASGLPSVTEILRDSGLVQTGWFSEEARDRGSKVHRACLFFDEGDLDEDVLDPKLLTRLNSYKKFLVDVRPKIIAAEEYVEVPGLYCGTLDRRLIMDGAESILDIKGVAQSPWHGVQLAMYAAPFNRKTPMKRWNLYLSETGYKLTQRTDPDDYRIGMAAVTFTHWKRRNPE